jgi:hypothetical protein
MPVQNRSDNTNIPLILSDDSLVRSETIAQDAQRTTDLLYGTVMAKNATTGFWVPFTVLNDVAGESVPRGIYLGNDIEAADLVDGDIVGQPILVGNATVNESLVVWDDDTLDAESIVNPGTIEARQAREALADAAGIFLELTVDISEFEN